VQLGLFTPPLPEPSRLDVTLARLRALVGEQNVGSPRLDDTHRLDGAGVAPFRVSSAAREERNPAPQPAPPRPPRPALRLLRPPEAAAVTLAGGRPRAFAFRGRRYGVEHAYGPWQTSGEWWAETLWSGAQWDVVARAEGGPLLCGCLLEDLMDGGWQMVALYD
jgi:protein ImuB